MTCITSDYKSYHESRYNCIHIINRIINQISYLKYRISTNIFILYTIYKDNRLRPIQYTILYVYV